MWKNYSAQVIIRLLVLLLLTYVGDGSCNLSSPFWMFVPVNGTISKERGHGRGVQWDTSSEALITVLSLLKRLDCFPFRPFPLASHPNSL